MNSVIYELLRSDGSIVINKNLIRSIGLKEAVLYCELLSRYFYFKDKDRLQKDNSFYNTVEDLQDGTGLTKKQQTPTINRLKELGLIDMVVKGMPATRYFYIIDNEDILSKYIKQGKEIQQLRQKVTTRSDKRSLQVVTKGHGNNTKVNNTKVNNTKNNNNNDNNDIIPDKIKDKIALIREFIKEDITDKEIKMLLFNGKYNIDEIKRIYNLSKGIKKIENFIGFMIDGLKRNYTEPKAIINMENKIKKGSFNDYEQREYNFDELEKKLLGWN